NVLDSLINYIEKTTIRFDDANEILIENNSTPLRESVKIKSILARPQINFTHIDHLIPTELKSHIDYKTYKSVTETAEIELKYSGYIQREKILSEKIERLENIKIKNKFDYLQMKNLSVEARQKLERIRPETIGQASRIPGVSPSDINVLLIALGR
ncbi:MAG: tRNA uridine-5-carboxymethylaminomethyl(34) synthesis enzyme MnmG, partial [Bacteroidales bacterium]